jgi:CheY-like chemotaxis protein
MLRRILQNLLANALRYTRTGGVLMGCRPRGHRVCIQVCDTGPGVPKAQQEAIFIEFQRGESSFGDQAGFGLGLSIVRRFTNALRHDVHISSQLGHGSTFSVELDRADLADVPQAERAVQRLDVQCGGLEGAKILLIENDCSSAAAMVGLLEGWGCDVATTVSTEEALERLGALGGAPDAIIADLHLDHDRNGLVAVEEIRRHTQLDIPAMIVTADYSEAAAREAGRHGLEVLKKPVKPAEMRALLSFLLT